jgi:NADH:ubiquinone oxidoreductase subunit K
MKRKNVRDYLLKPLIGGIVFLLFVLIVGPVEPFVGLGIISISGLLYLLSSFLARLIIPYNKD